MIDELICMLMAISCCNKFSIVFVFIQEPGQNVRCHKFDGPCECLPNYVMFSGYMPLNIKFVIRDLI